MEYLYTPAIIMFTFIMLWIIAFPDALLEALVGDPEVPRLVVWAIRLYIAVFSFIVTKILINL